MTFAGQWGVVRAARKAERAQNAKEIVADIVGGGARNVDRCQWCGGPSPNRDGVCPGHRDLGGVR